MVSVVVTLSVLVITSSLFTVCCDVEVEVVTPTAVPIPDAVNFVEVVVDKPP